MSREILSLHEEADIWQAKTMRLGWWLITSRLASGVNGFAPKSRFFTSLRALKHLSIGYSPELSCAMSGFRVGSGC
jgi:hypothetical protein